MTLPRSFVRPLVRPMVRSGAVGPYGGATYQDGIHLNFASGNTTSGYYVKAVGAAPTVSPLTSLFTFTGGNQSMYMGPAGLLVPSVTNTPRIEYGPGGNCLGLLMEAARTNLSLQSQDWATSHSQVGLNAVGTNAATAPDGTVTADFLSEDTSSSQHRSRQTTDLTITSGSTNTFSVFVKAGQKTKVSLKMTENTFASSVDCVFDLIAGTVGTPTNIGVASGGVARIVPLPNGWYRCSISGALNGGFLTCRTLVELLNTAGDNITYTGDGSSGLYVWGEQFEAGATFASSYIPTTTVSVARTADSCIRTLGSEFSATAGTVVVAGRASGGQSSSRQPVFSFDDNTANERIPVLRPGSTDSIQLRIDDGGVNQAAIGDTFVNSTAFKAAAAWAANDAAFVFNTGTLQTDATLTLPTVTQLGLGCEGGTTTQMNGHILRFDYWPERKTNAFLVSAST